MPKPSRGEWALGGAHLTGAVDGPWICDCLDYGLVPEPDEIGECMRCRRPVYDEYGDRVTAKAVAVAELEFMLTGYDTFVDEMRALGIHIGLGAIPVCVTCGEPWPCPSSRETT